MTNSSLVRQESGADQGHPVPLSFQQETYWEAQRERRVGYRLANGRYVANTFAALTVDGALDRADVQRVVEEIVTRHDSLRMRMVCVNGEWRQVTAPPKAVPVEFVDITNTPEDRRDDEVRAATTEAAFRPFDLDSGLMLRSVVVRAHPEQHIVAFVVPHIVSDSVSLQILLKEFIVLCLHYSHSKPSPLPALTAHYADFVRWQREWLGGAIRDDIRRYVADSFGDLPSARLPTDRDESSHDDTCAEGAEIAVHLDRVTCGALTDFSVRRKVTPFVILLSAYATLLARWSARESILINLPFAGRPDARMYQVVGMFTNNSLLRMDVFESDRFLDVVGRTESRLAEAARFGSVPLRILRDVARESKHVLPTSIAGTNSVPEGGKLIHGCERLLGRIRRIAPYVIRVDPGVAQRQMRGDLSLQFGFTNERRVSCRFLYRLASFKEQTIAAVAAGYEPLLKSFLGLPECRLSQHGASMFPAANRGTARAVSVGCATQDSE